MVPFSSSNEILFLGGSDATNLLGTVSVLNLNNLKLKTIETIVNNRKHRFEAVSNSYQVSALTGEITAVARNGVGDSDLISYSKERSKTKVLANEISLSESYGIRIVNLV